MLPVHIDLTPQEIMNQLTEISQRQFPSPGRRQVSYNDVETLLCYGLFYILDPHRYGGANIDTIPPDAKKLAAFFRRTPNSITNKMLNLDGSRPHSAIKEPQIFATLAANPTIFPRIYKEILTIACTIGIGEDIMPDFLSALSGNTQEIEDLIGQDDLPSYTAVLLSDEEDTMKELDHVLSLGEPNTEKMVEQKIRLKQHIFAKDVIQNCGRTCVFCGFEPRTLPGPSGLLRASHIKPWAASNHSERVDVQNGLAACPMHDAAFDQGYLTINGGYLIHRASILEESIANDPGVHLFFGEPLRSALLLPPNAKRPGITYLAYHNEHIFRR